MPVVTTKSITITNRDSIPSKLSDANIFGANVQEFNGLVEGITTDSIGSTYLFGQIPSNARVSQILLSCDDSGTTGAMDIGLYQNTANGGAVVDADFFASAQLLTTALVNSDVTHESGVFGIEDTEQPLWKALGLTSDPGINYDVVGTVTAALEANSTIGLKGRFVI